MRRGLIISGAIHLGLFLVVLLGPRPPAFEWERADAIPVDLVASVEEALPELEPEPVPEPPPVEPEPEPEPEPPAPEPEEVQTEPEERPEPTPVQQPRRKRRPPRRFDPAALPQQPDEPSLAERLRARLDDVEEPAADTPPPDTPRTSPPPAPPRTDAEVEASDFPFAWYLNLLRTKITDSWDPPATRILVGRENQVILRFRLARDGHVTDLSVETSSRTPGLETSARRAIERAAPFPPLPESWDGDVLDVAVRFTVAEGGE